jgi:hypothetical protein
MYDPLLGGRRGDTRDEAIERKLLKMNALLHTRLRGRTCDDVYHGLKGVIARYGIAKEYENQVLSASCRFVPSAGSAQQFCALLLGGR